MHETDETKWSVPMILASASPRRRELLRACGLEVTVVPADIDAVCGFANGNESIDNIEAQAYREVFGEDVSVICVKEQFGEARAATAALGAAYAAEILAGKTENELNVCTVTESGVESGKLASDGLKYILAVSFGLDGSYSAVVVKKA